MDFEHFRRSLDLTLDAEDESIASEQLWFDERNSIASSASTMSSEETKPASSQDLSEKDTAVFERRERNRIAQQRYRRNMRSELVLMRHKAVKYFEREVALCKQLVIVSQEKNAAMEEAAAQKRLIEEMTKRLKISAGEYGALQTKFTVLVNAHCQLLQRSHAMAQTNAAQATQNAQQCAQTPRADAPQRFA